MVYSGMTCSERPFINVTLSPIANTQPGKAAIKHHHIWCFNLYKQKFSRFYRPSATFVFIYLPDDRDIYWMCV